MAYTKAQQKVQEFMDLLDDLKTSIVSSKDDPSKFGKSLIKVYTFFNLNKQILRTTKNIDQFVEAFNNLLEYRRRLEQHGFKPKSEEELFSPFNKLVDAINNYIVENSVEEKGVHSVKIEKIVNSNFQIGSHNIQIVNYDSNDFLKALDDFSKKNSEERESIISRVSDFIKSGATIAEAVAKFISIIHQ